MEWVMGWSGTNPAEWARKAKESIRNTYRESVQELGIEMSTGSPSGTSGPGILPVVTSNLANSVLVQVGSMPKVAPPDTKFTAPDLAAAQFLEVGSTAYIGYQANYARRINYGFVGEDSLGRNYNQAGRGFVERAAAKWPTIVAEAAARVCQRSGG